MTGFESGLLFTALGVFGGASIVGWQVVAGQRRGRALLPMLGVGALALLAFLVSTAIREGQLPLGRRYEVLVLTAWVLAVGAWVVHWRKRLPVLGAVAAPALALLVLFALLIEPGSGAPSKSTLQRLAHVVPGLLGFAALTMAAGVGSLYLWQIRLVKRHPVQALSRRLPPLERLDRINFAAAATGFPLLAGSALGGWLFAGETSRWYVDPTVLATVAGLLVYTVLFSARALLGWHGRRIAWLTVVGFVVIVVGFVVAVFCTVKPQIHTT